MAWPAHTSEAATRLRCILILKTWTTVQSSTLEPFNMREAWIRHGDADIITEIKIQKTNLKKKRAQTTNSDTSNSGSIQAYKTVVEGGGTRL